MSWLLTVMRELFGLFVDDVPYTAAIVIWIAAAGLVLPRLPLSASWDAPLMAAGCVLVLIVSSTWAAVKYRRHLYEASLSERRKTE